MYLLDLIECLLDVMGQALEDIVLRGTDIYAFTPMEDRDRAQVKILQCLLLCSNRSNRELNN